MLLRTLRYCVVLFILIFAGAVAMHGQAVVEYGAAMGISAAVTAAVKPPVPNLGLPETTPNAGLARH